MASTSRQSSLFGTTDWKKAYQAYSAADLQSYDYESLRAGFIAYLTQQYPEAYNDYVESSEFVALMDVMAYMGQALAFRSDLNARESFIDTAQRRDSVIKLANLVGYNPKRNIAGQGLVKVTAISTTENISDINGVNLSNQTILWNDAANSSWQEQFNTILNAALLNNQRIGKPGNSQTLLDIKTDEYTMNIPSGILPVMPYQAQVDGQIMNFELVSTTSLNQTYLYEVPPAPNGQFNILYRNDKLGYGSINTGFFFYFKQGQLQTSNFSFKEKIQNNLQQINVQGVNNEDTWLYSVDNQGTVDKLWTQVESIYAGTTSTTGVKTLYSVASRANDEVSYVFGDGVFGQIPIGSYRAYLRSSNALKYTIDTSEMSGLTATINYVSRTKRTEQLTFTFSLQVPCSTSQNRETLTNIKERAPAKFYSQNRMVNGEDYTSFPFTLYNSIIKSKALNRTSIGVSRNLDLLDPTGKYSSTNIFSDDGALTFSDTSTVTTFSTSSSNYATEFLTSTLPALLNRAECVQYYHTYYGKQKGTVGVEHAKKRVFWQLVTISGSQVTGYFYTTADNLPTTVLTNQTPQALGSFSSDNLKFISTGALIKLQPVNKDYRFDSNNRLVANTTDKEYLWVGVDNVSGDGYNYGTGKLANGHGPVTLSAYIPNGTMLFNDIVIDSTTGNDDDTSTGAIIPSFDNTLSSTIAGSALGYIRLQKDFVLQYNNTLSPTSERWSVIAAASAGTTPASYLVKFTYSSSDSKYTVTVRNVTYSFASVSGVRFLFDSNKRVYDPKTGAVLSDFVKLTETDIVLNVTDQPVQSDGFKNDFEVSVSPINATTGYSSNPDFFTAKLNGNTVVEPNSAVFFSRDTETSGIETLQLLTAGKVIYTTELSTFDLVNNKKEEYPVDTVFYCVDALTANLVVSKPNAAPANTQYTVTATTSMNHKIPTGNVTIQITGASNSYTYLDASSNSNITVDYSVLNGTHQGTVGASTVANSANTITFTVTNSSNAIITGTTITGEPKPVPVTIINRFYKSSEDATVIPPVTVMTDVTPNYLVKPGKGSSIKFQYRHNSGQTSRIDPATTNIIDLYLVTQSYYTQYTNWITDTTGGVAEPSVPTINELQQSYAEINSYKMISDAVVLNSVRFKPLFGSKAEAKLRATIKVVKNSKSTASDSQIRSSVLSALNSYFAIENWDFGDVMYFTELSAYLHAQLGSLISSVILVPTDPTLQFGDMYEVRCEPDQIFVNGATASDISVITSLTAANMGR
jgi:hypothetical protein